MYFFCFFRPCKHKKKQKQDLIIHLIGAEIECDLLPLFKDLLCLIPGINMQIYMFGANIVPIIKNYTLEIENSKHSINFYIYSSMYSKTTVERCIEIKKHRIPSIFIGLNAGLCAGPYLSQWPMALEAMFSLKSRVPGIFTEYLCLSVRMVIKNFPKKFNYHETNPFASSYVTVSPYGRMLDSKNGQIFGWKINT